MVITSWRQVITTSLTIAWCIAFVVSLALYAGVHLFRLEPGTAVTWLLVGCLLFRYWTLVDSVILWRMRVRIVKEQMAVQALRQRINEHSQQFVRKIDAN